MLHSRLLNYIDEVARTGSIRKAADRLNVAASAISRQILALETQLGTPIFQRLPKKVILTAAGEVLIGHVRQTLKDTQLMLDQARKAGQQLPLLQIHADVLQACVRHGDSEQDNSIVIEDGREGILAAARGARLLVVGLSERWKQEGLGETRSQLARSSAAPILFVRRGQRAGALAPRDNFTRFNWSSAGLAKR